MIKDFCPLVFRRILPGGGSSSGGVDARLLFSSRKSCTGRKANVQIRVVKPPFEARVCHAYWGKSTVVLKPSVEMGVEPLFTGSLRSGQRAARW